MIRIYLSFQKRAASLIRFVLVETFHRCRGVINGKGKGITSRGCGQPPREAGEGKAREKDKKKGKKHPRSRLAQAGSGERPVRKDQAGVTTEEKQA
jgi:hypothetical protein